jgi:hypothetical protein
MLLLSPSIADPVLAMIAMGLASFALDLALPGCTCMDVGGRFAGTLSGSMNVAGNIAGGVAPVAVGYILKYSKHNRMMTFWISAAIYGGLCWRWIDPVTPLESEGSAQSRQGSTLNKPRSAPGRKHWLAVRRWSALASHWSVKSPFEAINQKTDRNSPNAAVEN